mgnify:CR=1 FL=1
MQTSYSNPALTLYLAEIAQGLEPILKLLPELREVPQLDISDSTHEVTGQLVLSEAVKNSS